jgi:hypothetical protein
VQPIAIEKCNFPFQWPGKKREDYSEMVFFDFILPQREKNNDYQL